MVDLFRAEATTALAGAAAGLAWSLHKANRRAAKWRSRAYEAATAADVWEKRALATLNVLQKLGANMPACEITMDASATGFVATVSVEGEARRISYEYGSDQFFWVGQDANEELDLDECEATLRVMLDFARSSYLNVRNETEG